MGFFDKREAFEGAGETGGDGGFVEGDEFEFGHGGVEEVDAGHEFFDALIQEWEVEGSASLNFGEAAPALVGVEVALLGLLLDDEVVKADEFHGTDSFVFWIEEVLQGGAEMLGKHFGDPLGFHGGGEAEEGQGDGAARGHLVEVGSDEIRRILHDAFAHELAFPLLCEVADEFGGLASFGELIDEAGHEAAKEGVVVF